MHELLSIKLCALRSARLFPRISIHFKPAEGVLGRVTIPRSLFLFKRDKRMFLVFTKNRIQAGRNVFGLEYLESEDLLFESHEAGEHTTHDFGELFQFIVKEKPEEHYLNVLAGDYDKEDNKNAGDSSSPIEIFGSDLTSLVNRCCCHNIGKRFEGSIDVLHSYDEDCFGRDLLDMISDVCILAPSQDVQLRNRLLKEARHLFGCDLVDFVADRSREIFEKIRWRFNPNLFIRLLLAEERISPRDFDY